jgi:hypothetical protein
VEPGGGSNESDYQLEDGKLLARIAAIEGATHFIPRLLTLKPRFGLNFGSAGFGVFSSIEDLDGKVFDESPSQPIPVRVAALEASSRP